MHDGFAYIGQMNWNKIAVLKALNIPGAQLLTGAFLSIYE